MAIIGWLAVTGVFLYAFVAFIASFFMAEWMQKMELLCFDLFLIAVMAVTGYYSYNSIPFHIILK